MCGWPAKMMVHIGGVETPQLMSDILNVLRPGDVLTHAYSGAPNMAGAFTNIVQDGKLLPAALAAKQRGVIFDVGHGGGSFDFTVAEAAIPAGCAPDTISSDIHVFSGNTPGTPYLPNVMGKFMAMGFSLEQVVAMGDRRAGQDHQSCTEDRHAPVGRARRRLDHGTWWRGRSLSSTPATTSARAKSS